MPFTENGVSTAGRGRLTDGLTRDIITSIAKLKAFPVIALGSVCALSERGIDPQKAGLTLGVEYVASGDVALVGGRAVVSTELIDVESARIVWSERFDVETCDLSSTLSEIGTAIVSGIASQIELAERDHALLKSPTSLSAWEMYHRGLWHMYRFTKEENARACHFFVSAIKLDPTFARAHSGLSFTHWQSAFQGWDNFDRRTELAYDAAGQSLLADGQSPDSHLAMGRALWLMRNHDESLNELSKAVALSPHLALAHYAIAFVQSQSGDPSAAIEAADQSRRLSPYDPMLFGMLGARAISHVRLGQHEEAAEWAVRAATQPNAHTGILAIAANSLGLAGRLKEGHVFAARIHARQPGYSFRNFVNSFRFDSDGKELFRKGAKAVGIE
jgi:TolB-like protein